jgi:hypothetical protein
VRVKPLENFPSDPPPVVQKLSSYIKITCRKISEKIKMFPSMLEVAYGRKIASTYCFLLPVSEHLRLFIDMLAFNPQETLFKPDNYRFHTVCNQHLVDIQIHSSYTLTVKNYYH